MRKILITTGIFPPDIGGPASYVPRFGKFLAAKGLAVKVITLSDLKSEKNEKYPFQLLRIRRKITKPIRFLLTIAFMIHEMRKVQFVFSNGLYLETAIALKLGLFRGSSLVKIVGDPVWERKMNHKSGTRTDLDESNFAPSTLSEKIERRLICWSLKQFDFVTTPGSSLAEKVEGWGRGVKVRVIHNGVSLSPKSTDFEPDYDLICVSRLVPWKNVEVVVSLALELDLSLAIIGDGPDFQKISNQSKNSKKIHMFGSVSSEQILELLYKAKIFCQLSDYEGLSFSLLQAMAASRPCLVSDIKANRDVFVSDQNAAVFAKVDDFEGLRRATLQLVEDEAKRMELGERSYYIAKTFFDESEKMQQMMDLLVLHD